MSVSRLWLDVVPWRGACRPIGRAAGRRGSQLFGLSLLSSSGSPLTPACWKKMCRRREELSCIIILVTSCCCIIEQGRYLRRLSRPTCPRPVSAQGWKACCTGWILACLAGLGRTGPGGRSTWCHRLSPPFGWRPRLRLSRQRGPGGAWTGEDWKVDGQKNSDAGRRQVTWTGLWSFDKHVRLHLNKLVNAMYIFPVCFILNLKPLCFQ